MKTRHLLITGLATLALGMTITTGTTSASANTTATIRSHATTLKVSKLKYHYAEDNDNYYYNVYTPAYLQADYKPQKLYTTAKGALNKTGKSITLKSIYKKIAVRWVKKYDKQDLLYVRVDGKTYYKLDTNAIQSFNSWRESKTILSPYAPSSTSKIMFEKGTKISKVTKWRKVVHHNNGTKTVMSWHKKNGTWVKNK